PHCHPWRHRPARRVIATPRPGRPARIGGRPGADQVRAPRRIFASRNHKRKRMKKEMLINVLQPEECRIAIVEDGVLEELYVERASQESYVGNIYKGRIVNIEPSIQAAFVDFGIGRNGFLHVSDVDPVYYKHLLPKDVQAQLEAEDEDGPPPPRRDRDRDRDRDRGGRGGRSRDRDRDRPVEPRPTTSFLEPA